MNKLMWVDVVVWRDEAHTSIGKWTIGLELKGFLLIIVHNT